MWLFCLWHNISPSPYYFYFKLWMSNHNRIRTKNLKLSCNAFYSLFLLFIHCSASLISDEINWELLSMKHVSKHKYKGPWLHSIWFLFSQIALFHCHDMLTISWNFFTNCKYEIKLEFNWVLSITKTCFRICIILTFISECCIYLHIIRNYISVCNICLIQHVLFNILYLGHNVKHLFWFITSFSKWHI